ncbi:MAG TPA: glycosyltransferase, partial [Phycisphaerae bacterium]|nr:glycosyltransferase [Phycisphaerae bacterium]
PEGYPYPDRVRFEIRQTNQVDYRLAAEFLNVHQVSTVCLQHEYGIFGGTCGSHILGMLRRLRRPLVVTLHTVLHDPSDEQRLALQEICRLADRVAVMTDIAHGMLEEVFDVAPEKICTIPHGIQDTPFVDPHFFKDQFEIEGRKVLFTFGLLSPGKGIEYAIEALPAIVEKHPELIYILLGATHPHVKRQSGEEYRNSLRRRAEELGLSDNIRFVNRFVELKELCEYLGAADLYLTPYLNEAQITSGTLAYAMGTGKATISTPYWYAKEMLAEGRGILVPFRDHEAISKEVIGLLDNETELHTMRKRAYTYCRRMIWSRVAQDYLDLFAEAKDAWLERKSQPVAISSPADKSEDELPETDLRHLRMMTDDTGIFQHCLFATPDRNHGYCVDDNTRALIVTAMHWDQTHDESILGLMQTYLSFLSYAFNEETGRFRNFMGYDRRFMEEVGSEDSHARSLWGLGTGVALCPHESMIALASQLFHSALGVTEKFTSPRAWAFTIAGIQAYLRRFGGDSEVRRVRASLAEKLLSCFHNYSDQDWPWCENIVSYASAKIPHALLMCGKWMQRNDMIDVGKRSLEWLVKIQTSETGTFSFIGTDGWLTRDGNFNHFDQQPIEAHAMVEACIEAYRVTRESRWLDYARRGFNWFLGGNDLRTPLYDFTTGGCRDGLHPD